MKRIFQGLRKTRERFLRPLRDALSSGELDEEAIEEAEAILYSADLGVEATERIIESIRERGEGDHMQAVADELLSIIDEIPAPPVPEGSPRVIVIIGVNGVGKTSTIGKLAARFKGEGKSVILAAGDTFRAAAIDQLELWGERTGTPVVRQKMGSDPAAVAFDAVQSAKAKGVDIVIVDTAGRLHTKVNLMEELGKIFRVLRDRMEGIALEAWLILDANSGQNSLRQAEAFTERLPVTGIVLAKLDSTAKGGAVIPIQQKLGLPVLFVGVGEGADDLEPFDHSEFVAALIGG
ncbi:MAG: signal recognition particle-docking protein FtsY [Candidatus Krumholzibacteria bacterium]|nr:signal recognition particle-docking protein FtsY [Candidatus Krumholzibacteria bacterium]